MEKIGESVYWVDADKIVPNPFQPRHAFDDIKLHALANSIKQYGVLQPLLVTRKELRLDDGGMETSYELLAGERRLRASKIAGIRQVPVVIRTKEDEDQIKFEIAIIENLQREDLTPIDRAEAFKKLTERFNLTHIKIAEKVGKSREYVSNSIRLLSLPENMLEALREGKISEGHSRPILMLQDRPEEQTFLFNEILLRGLTVRDAERIARRMAEDKIRSRKRDLSPELKSLEQEMSHKLGTDVYIESKGNTAGGKILINYFTEDDLAKIFEAISSPKAEEDGEVNAADDPENFDIQDKKGEDDLYSFKNFSV